MREIEQIAHARAAEPDHADGHADDQRRAAEIRLREQQHDEHDGDADRLDHAEQLACTLFSMAHQIARHIDDEQQLHRFDGLEADEAQIESSDARR